MIPMVYAPFRVFFDSLRTADTVLVDTGTVRSDDSVWCLFCTDRTTQRLSGQ